LHDLGPLGDRLLEDLEVFLGRQRQLGGAIYLEAQAQFLAIQDGHAALDDARVFQPLDPAPAWAGRQPDSLGDLGDGQSGVVLDEIEDLGIHSVELFGQEFLPPEGDWRVDRAQSGLESGTPWANNFPVSIRYC